MEMSGQLHAPAAFRSTINSKFCAQLGKNAKKKKLSLEVKHGAFSGKR
jgi:hypothetical protein